MKQRNIVVCILLGLITCGLYGICWMTVLNDDTNSLSGRQGASGGMAFLFTLITRDTYGLFWMCQMGNVVEMLHDQHGGPRGSAPMVYLLLSSFDLGIVPYVLLQNESNKYLSNA